MKPNVLFLVHVEEMFRRFFPDDLYPLRLKRSAMAARYDRVIILSSEVDELGISGKRGVICELAHLHHETWVWGWGYEAGVFYDDGEIDWVIESAGHEYTWIPHQLRDNLHYFRNANIFIGGGCRGECLADWESVLEYLDLPHKRVEGLIYG